MRSGCAARAITAPRIIPDNVIRKVPSDSGSVKSSMARGVVAGTTSSGKAAANGRLYHHETSVSMPTGMVWQTMDQRGPTSPHEQKSGDSASVSPMRAKVAALARPEEPLLYSNTW